jgi:hypothetical protein
MAVTVAAVQTLSAPVDHLAAYSVMESRGTINALSVT